ncbi:hypothetical protein WICMUC_000328 [Wickerhamomyces mucosus]|uniref:Phosphatidylethanolamine N-methyltransferase n=1 Tax=Wickerhamomyces mucosus TaxID=1378264 RepID=A0A9P8PZG1_9ASCO|nr:hypothetical protein WICMUC_000328 [Wickerhamomyces mucosus]
MGDLSKNQIQSKVNDNNDDVIIEEDDESSNQINNTNNKLTIGKTDDGIIFKVPKTYDMIRSLFDPTIKKSYGELLICLTLGLNFFIYNLLPNNSIRLIIFTFLYTFWRLSYNLGIGIILYKQSNEKWLVNLFTKYGLFNKYSKTWIQYLINLEIKSKMGYQYKIDQFPKEFNTWLLFRQFVDLILMQDFITYMFIVWYKGLNQLTKFINYTILDYIRVSLGILLILFNFWVKFDAHRVVKDYAWYWGDFFFLQESNLIFDGVFNLFPHPMYSVGYIGYYGFALITESYYILIISILAHSLQFIFLLYVEEPHINKIYGNGSENDNENVKISEFILENHENYIKPMIIFKNFNPIVRPIDLLLLIITIIIFISPFLFEFNNDRITFIFFNIALIVKLIQSLITINLLKLQSSKKIWTKIFLQKGFNNLNAFINWQIIYNILLVLSYSTLFTISIREILNGQFWQNYHYLSIRLILGSTLILLQIWTSSYILNSIGEFGWFYGDFFLSNEFNSFENKKKLTKTGIYRYLNNPERFLGISGIWGISLITYSKYVFFLAIIWSLNISYLLTFVEKPHMIKIYGEQQILKNISGVSLELNKILPKSFNQLSDPFEIITKKYKSLRSQSEINLRSNYVKFGKLPQIINPLYSLKVINIGDDDFKYNLGKDRLQIQWKAPQDHGYKDWIGLYKVLNTGKSRTTTYISSFGKWLPINSKAYSNEVEFNENIIKIDGILDFTEKLTGLENGVYEFRYHKNESHQVLSISEPFEISIPILKNLNDEFELSENLLNYFNNLLFKDNNYKIETKFENIEFNKIKNEKLFEIIVSNLTDIKINFEVLKKLKTVQGISNRIIQSKKILKDLNFNS